jgi:small subunit ribosomal protein S16
VSVKIRLLRVGRKKIPCYRIVVMDSRKRRDGAYLEQLGVYHPKEVPARVEVKEDRAMHWLSVGALPSDTVRSLLSSAGVMTRFDLSKRGAKHEEIEAAVAKVKEAAASRVSRKLRASSKKKDAAPIEETPAETVAPKATPEAEKK